MDYCRFEPLQKLRCSPDILPAYATPCTNVITEVKWGVYPHVVLHYRKSEDGCRHEPVQISDDSIKDYIVYPEKIESISPYEKV